MPEYVARPLAFTEMLNAATLGLRFAEAGQMITACPLSDSDVLDAGPVRLLAKNWPLSGREEPLRPQADTVPWMLPPTVWETVVRVGASVTVALRWQLATGTMPAAAGPARAPAAIAMEEASVVTATSSRRPRPERGWPVARRCGMRLVRFIGYSLFLVVVGQLAG